LDTLEDGYEKHFAPKHPFKRRLWTQGRLDFKGSGLPLGEWAECKEDLFKVVQSDNATDVWIERRMYSGASGNPESCKVRELRCLRYLRYIPSSKSVDITVDKKPLERDVLLSHTFTPSRILLTRFSFLTHNFHQIHVDSEYARNIEQYPDVIMHGSLSIILILSTFSQFCESTNSPQSITQAKYVMYRPLYVNNPVTLTITSRKDGRKRAILWDNHNQKAVECIITQIP
jgi:hydroxyacyl-ACP dehydratase HTD2-like protein with hotdog domain